MQLEIFNDLQQELCEEIDKSVLNCLMGKSIYDFVLGNERTFILGKE